MKLDFKWLRIPASNETKDIEVVRTWTVRWTGRTDPFNSGTVPYVEVFTDNHSANEFAKSLRSAFALLRITGDGTEVFVKENK
jgi:hypothetical protein